MEETPSEAGAGQLLRIQAMDRMGSLAARIGAQLEVHRTQHALVYELTGSLADLDFLGWILREGVKPPADEAFEPARRILRVDLERQLETPQGVLHARTRQALVPGSGSVFGGISALERLTPGALRSFWERSYRPESVRIVVAGRISGALVRSFLGDLGFASAPPPPPPPQGSLANSPAAPQVVRSWLVLARPLPPGSEAASLVGARWIGEVLRATDGDFESAVEIWDLPSGRALVLTGAAYPRSRQAMERGVSAVLGEAADRLTPEVTRRLADEVRTEILLAARTPWGLADLAGQAWDTGHGPDGVQVFLSTLLALDAASVQTLLRSLASVAPVRQELRP
jgi:predicted Zn-dependent peptidase